MDATIVNLQNTDVNPKDPYVDPRVRRTRQLLQQALLALLREKSFEAITVNDIAERSTVNRVTFYDHYTDKFALFDDIIAESFRPALKARFTEEAPFCLGKLHQLILTVCDFLAQLPGDCEDQANHKLLDLLSEAKVKTLLEELVLASLPETWVGREMTATLVSSSTYAACKKWSQSSPRMDSVEFAKQIAPFIEIYLPKDEPNE